MTVKRSIQQKIAATMLIAGLLPGFFGVFFTYRLGIKALKDSIGANLKTIAVEASEKIDIIIRREIHNTRSLAISPLIIAAVKGNHKDAVIQSYIERYQRQSGGKIISITVMDKRGGSIAAAGKSLPIRSPHKPSSEKREVFVGDILFDQATQHYSMLIAVPIVEDETKKEIGDIMIVYNIAEIFGVVNSIRVGMTGHANLVASDGTLLVCPLFPPRSHTINNRLLNQISMAQPGWGITPDDAHGGKNSIIGFAPVKSTFEMGRENFGGKKWHIFIRQLPEETYSPIYALLWKVSVLGIILVSLLLPLGYVVAIRIVRPIKILSDGAKLIGEGRLNQNMDIKTGDEIEGLAETFNQMTQNLNLTMQRLLHSERIAAMGRFSSTFAHDIRNPIIAIKKTLQMIKKSPASIDERVYDDLISACGLLLGLVNDMLDIHQVSYKDLPLLYSSFSPGEVLDEAIKLLKIEAEEKGIYVERGGRRDIVIEGDKRRIERVFINLLSNAIKYSPPNGKIRISFDASADTNNLLFKIEDEGTGIEIEDISKIFDLFYRKEKNGIKSGTGLGLYFCKVVIEAHHGKIWAENRDKGGAVFHIEMPLTQINRERL